MVNETPGSRVLDLGCGTGRLTTAIAAAGHAVTGVDPAKASLDEARSKPGADEVTWVEGTSTVLADTAFETAVMTSHVGQFFTDDVHFSGTLTDLKRALVPGGRLVLDSRDPPYRRWERWNPVDSRHQVKLGDGSEVNIWTEVTNVYGDIVDFTHHYVWPNSEELTSTASLRFRTESALREALRTENFSSSLVHKEARFAASIDWEMTITARIG